MVAGKYGHRSVFEGITVGILLMAFITGCSHCEPKKLILSIILRGGKHTHTHSSWTYSSQCAQKFSSVSAWELHTDYPQSQSLTCQILEIPPHFYSIFLFPFSFSPLSSISFLSFRCFIFFVWCMAYLRNSRWWQWGWSWEIMSPITLSNVCCSLVCMSMLVCHCEISELHSLLLKCVSNRFQLFSMCCINITLQWCTSSVFFFL